eukprot:TRINITY_DN2463_c0_g1_i1.p1 TRINITY_DN2463_c0_g1~~TRINITY_DN2463_c0_g1_i1.p1  ORF type:complete len:1089 (+),score=389.86 TRINITY_DN2463_c0_g1_i1:222-3269(+)
MNGRMHLGHTFTVTKVEFAIAYQRLKGKRALFPFAFHCTGMPIKTCADKLKREMETYGNPPIFPPKFETPAEEGDSDGSEKKVDPKKKEDPTKFVAKKSKAAAKTGNATYQWEILTSIGIPQEEIPRFADASYWLSYFPPHCKDDFTKMGLGVDWRRSFITTDVNPYYDSFVRWQFHMLKDLGKVHFGQRYTVYSAKDGQPCADHDRASGEGVVPQDYTLIKLELQAPFPQKLKSLEGKKRVFLVAGTLRPETMYGQTNCWVLPEGKYGAFETNNADEIFICTERSAKNMAFQGLSPAFGKVVCVAQLTGHDILGIPLKSPLTKYDVVYTLPMLSISPNKGTGIVTSVPSDSPDDYMNLEELRKKPAFREKFGLKDEMVLPYEVIPIIQVPEYGDVAAKTVCEMLKIKSPNDRVLLDDAKEKVYMKGFYEGVMMVGEFAGEAVKDAKPKLKEKLIKSGDAVLYSEPASLVMSRSGDECVVALTDQWFLSYGETEWRTQVEEHMKNMEFYSEDTKNRFEIGVGWLNQWACSRTYGLGTKLPWDEKYLIESLSDSTIYMAYYSIAHFLQGNVDGSKPGSLGISADKFTKEVWSYVFLNGKYPENCGISESDLQKMRKEFEYWYPLDLRVSGKDLITNHLIFCLYNHAAIFPKLMPRSFRTNGHLLLNGEKMSKSTGNFMTLTEAVDEFSADGLRLGLADAGDTLDDANFTTSAANNAILRLYTQIKWTEDIMAEIEKCRDGPVSTFDDKVFESAINKCIQETDVNYERTNYKDALRTGFFDLQNARDDYRLACGSQQAMNKSLVLRFIEVQAILMSPVVPHFSQRIFNILGKNIPIQKAKWPVAGNIDDLVLKQHDYLKEVIHNFRLKRQAYIQPKAKKGEKPKTLPAPTTGVIHVVKEYPPWVQTTLKIAAPFFAEQKSPEPKQIWAAVTAGNPELSKMTKVGMPFVVQLKEDFATIGQSALSLSLPFDEKLCLTSSEGFIKQSLELENLSVDWATEEVLAKAGNGKPGKPIIQFS